MKTRRSNGSRTSQLDGAGTADSRSAGKTDSSVVLWTIDEVAEFLRVPVLTVRWLRQEGRFPAAIKVGRRLVWDQRDIEAWVESSRETNVGAA